MTNMFSQKKSVQEGLEMLPEISLEKLRAEFAQLARKQRITKEKSKREQMQYERLLRLEKFIKNFPDGKPA
jgi:dynactin complex subunit